MGYREDTQNMHAEFITPEFNKRREEGADDFFVEHPITTVLREIVAADLAEENRQLKEEIKKLTQVIGKLRTLNIKEVTNGDGD